MDFDSLVVHGDRSDDDDGALAPPIHPAATFRAASGRDFAEMATVPRHDRYYTRYGNPTLARCERLLAGLEGAESALLFGSGMGAISATMLALLSAGDHVVAQASHYMGTAKLLTDLLPRFGVRASCVDQTDAAAIAAAIEPATRLIVVETPSNPTMALTDLGAVAALARTHGIPTLADNTFASPVNQRPIELGIDLVVHSATKYLGGHHDLIAGALAGSRARLEQVWRSAIVLGATASPFDAWLLLRGLRTLPLRVRRQNDTALRLARFLAARPEVARVHYPGLESHPQHALAQRQMSGFGGVLSFEMAGGYAAAQGFVAALGMVANAVSLGGIETLAVHAASAWGSSLTPEQIARAGVSPALVRLSVGLESVEDLSADLDQALRAAG
jgi:cystathionine beta-lyase/cystathionine gamma-synthase